jgi:hypothetical protein
MVGLGISSMPRTSNLTYRLGILKLNCGRKVFSLNVISHEMKILLLSGSNRR